MYGRQRSTWKGIISHSGNINQNHKSTSHSPRWLCSRNRRTTSVDEDVGGAGQSCAAGGIVKWCTCCGRQLGSSSPASYQKASTPKKLKPGIQTSTRAHMFRAALPTTAKRGTQSWPINSRLDCGLSTRWNMIQPQKGMKYWHVYNVDEPEKHQV